MHLSLLFTLALVAFSSATTLFGDKDILVSQDGSKIVVFKDDGKAVQIQNDKFDLTGKRVIEIQVTGPNKVTKTVKVEDGLVDIDGTTQSTVLLATFGMFEGKVNEDTFEGLLDTIAKQVMTGKISQQVLVALQVLRKQNEDVFSQETLEQTLEDKEIRDIVEQRSLVGVMLNQQQQQQLLRQNQMTSSPLMNMILGRDTMGTTEVVIDKMLEEKEIKEAIYGKKNVLVSRDGTKIVIINQNGKAVKIDMDKVGLNGKSIIEVQITTPEKVTKTIYINDKVVDVDGTQLSTILAAVFTQFQGTLRQDTFNNLLHTVSQLVSTEKIHPIILVVLESLNKDNVSTDIQIKQLLQELEFDNTAQKQILRDTMYGQGRDSFLLRQRSPWNQIQTWGNQQSNLFDIVGQQGLRKSVIERELQKQAINQDQTWGQLGGFRGIVGLRGQDQLIRKLQNQQQLSQILDHQTRIRLGQQQQTLGGIVPSQQQIWGLNSMIQSPQQQWWNTGRLGNQDLLTDDELFAGRTSPLGLQRQLLTTTRLPLHKRIAL